MEYMSPGDAYSTSIEDTLAKRAQLQHQQLLDSLAVQREANNNQWHQDEVAARLEESKARHADVLERANDRDRADFEKRLSGMLPGDIADAGMQAQAQRLGLSHMFTPKNLPPVAPIPGSSTMSGMISQGDPNGPQAPPIAAGTPVTPPEAPDSLLAPAPEGSVYIGNRADRLQAIKDKKAADSIARIKNLEPGSPEFRQAVLEHESLTGKNVSADFAKPAKTKTHVIFDPIKKTYTLPDGTVTTDIPEDAVVDRAAEPRAANDSKEATQLQHAYDGAIKEWNDSTKTVQGHLDALSELGGILDIKSPQADTLVAPILLKATISGQGSGFRMTRAEIDNVLHGRSTWEDLKASIQKWSTEPSKANLLTDDQRTQMRDLAKFLGQKARATMASAQAIRDKIDASTDPSEIKTLRSDLRKALTPTGESDTGTKIDYDTMLKKYGGD